MFNVCFIIGVVFRFYDVQHFELPCLHCKTSVTFISSFLCVCVCSCNQENSTAVATVQHKGGSTEMVLGKILQN